MTFRLQPAEPVPEGIRRIVIEQVDSGIQELTDRRRNPHLAIHSARQRCKRIRAVLRLVRDDLGGHYGVENQLLRDTARGLSEVRDAEAVIEAIDKLHMHCDKAREAGLARRARRALMKRHGQVTAGDEGLAARMTQAVASFQQARERVETWPLSTQGFDLLGPGIQKTYARGRKAFEAAYRKPSDAGFHETRKRVKYHWYQMRLVQNIWPAWLRAYRGQVKHLSDLLGDDHDLTVLRAILSENPTSLGAARNLDTILTVIDRRQAQLKADAHVLGRRIFSERPENFRRRLGRYWQAWQEEIAPISPAQDSTAVAARAVA